jgi:hypothetical protein
MPIDVACPGCKKKAKVPDAAAGKTAKCPACKTILRIPALSESKPAPKPTAPIPQAASMQPPLEIFSTSSPVMMGMFESIQATPFDSIDSFPVMPNLNELPVASAPSMPTVEKVAPPPAETAAAAPEEDPFAFLGGAAQTEQEEQSNAEPSPFAFEEVAVITPPKVAERKKAEPVKAPVEKPKAKPAEVTPTVAVTTPAEDDPFTFLSESPPAAVTPPVQAEVKKPAEKPKAVPQKPSAVAKPKAPSAAAKPIAPRPTAVKQTEKQSSVPPPVTTADDPFAFFNADTPEVTPEAQSAEAQHFDFLGNQPAPPAEKPISPKPVAVKPQVRSKPVNQVVPPTKTAHAAKPVASPKPAVKRPVDLNPTAKPVAKKKPEPVAPPIIELAPTFDFIAPANDAIPVIASEDPFNFGQPMAEEAMLPAAEPIVEAFDFFGSSSGPVEARPIPIGEALPIVEAFPTFEPLPIAEPFVDSSIPENIAEAEPILEVAEPPATIAEAITPMIPEPVLDSVEFDMLLNPTRPTAEKGTSWLDQIVSGGSVDSVPEAEVIIEEALPIQSEPELNILDDDPQANPWPELEEAELNKSPAAATIAEPSGSEVISDPKNLDPGASWSKWERESDQNVNPDGDDSLLPTTEASESHISDLMSDLSSIFQTAKIPEVIGMGSGWVSTVMRISEKAEPQPSIDAAPTVAEELLEAEPIIKVTPEAEPLPEAEAVPVIEAIEEDPFNFG